MRSTVFGCVVAAMVAVGCPSGSDREPADAGAGDGSVPAVFCARQHLDTTSDGEELPFCDELFPERPWVRLPPGRVEGSVDFHAAFVTAASRLVLTDGTTLFVPRDEPAFASVRTNRSIFTIWHVRGGTIGTGPEGRELRGASASAVLVISAEALESRFRGDWEGTITPRDPAGSGATQWSGTPVPLRISVGALGDLLPVSRDGREGMGPELPEGATHQVTGVFANYDSGVTSSTGDCIASLASLGERNPLRALLTDGSDAPNEVRLYRWLSMHGDFDDHAFLDPGYLMDMSFETTSPPAMGALHPANFIQDSERAAWSEIHDVMVHGTPSGFRIQYLRRVTGGGSPCTPT